MSRAQNVSKLLNCQGYLGGWFPNTQPVLVFSIVRYPSSPLHQSLPPEIFKKIRPSAIAPSTGISKHGRSSGSCSYIIMFKVKTRYKAFRGFEADGKLCLEKFPDLRPFIKRRNELSKGDSFGIFWVNIKQFTKRRFPWNICNMPLTLHYLLGLFSIISRVTSNFMGMRWMLVSWLSRLQYSCPSVRDRNPLVRKWMQETLKINKNYIYSLQYIYSQQ